METHPTEIPRFLADNTIGCLARWMRLLGYDVATSGDSARQLAERREQIHTGRILLGRCPGRSGAPAPAPHEQFVHVESEVLADQIRQIASRWPLDFSRSFLSRCERCNHPLSEKMTLETLPEALRRQVPPRVRERKDTFRSCTACGKVYWEGTHVEHMREFLRDCVGKNFI